MKTANTLVAVTLMLISIVASAEKNEQSIADLSKLSKHLIRKFECTVGLVVPAGFQEAKFDVDAVAGQTPRGSATVKIAADELTASASASLLNLEWKRDGKKVAISEMMIKNSPTTAFVLIAGDPNDDSAQASVNCVAVTYAEKTTNQGGRP